MKSAALPLGPTGPRSATPRTARQINDRLAVDLLLARGPLTRTELRRLTGLSGPTVASLVQRLEAAGLVAPVGESGSDRRGPNARLYGVVADRAYVAGVEVRPDVVVAVVTDLTGRSVGAAQTPQDPSAEPDRLVDAALRGALDDAGVDADRLRMLVVGTPGLVDPATGDVSFVATLPTWHANLLPGLRARYGDRVLLENEVNLAGLAEHRLGAALGRDTFALLWLGTGIGMAIVLDGRVLRGASGGAGELSYVPVASGSFQDHAGGPAVEATAREFGVLEPGDPRRGPGELVAAAVAAGPSGFGFLDALADRVAVGAAAVCAILDPGYVVLGGDVGRAGGDALATRVATRLAGLVPLPTEVVASGVGAPADPSRVASGRPSAYEDNPVVRGAVLVGLDRVHGEPFDATLAG
jgi:predicted NBD/HSP70 family sugar kinase